MAAIRRQILIVASPRAVWRALTTTEGIEAWWADSARVDAREGGRIILTSEDDDGNPLEERGIFHALRPIRRVEIAWDAAGKAPTRGTRVQFQVVRDGDETLLNLVHSGGGALDDEEARAALDKTWRQALNALRDALESGVIA